MGLFWKAPNVVDELVEVVLNKHHSSRLQMAQIAIALDDSKSFVKNKFNWGSVNKFSSFNKLWQNQKFDFAIVLCSDSWNNILNDSQKEALIDLHLTRCNLEYVPETVMEGKKKKVVKDDWGRIKFTNEIKVDDEGNPKWYISPLDIYVFVQNFERYGNWCSEFCQLNKFVSAEEQNEEQNEE